MPIWKAPKGWATRAPDIVGIKLEAYLMKITVKTAGTLGRFLPPGRQGNLADIEVAADATPMDVVRQLGMPEDGSYLIILNGATVPKAERPTHRLADGDKLSIMPPLKGG